MINCFNKHRVNSCNYRAKHLLRKFPLNVKYPEKYKHCFQCLVKLSVEFSKKNMKREALKTGKKLSERYIPTKVVNDYMGEFLQLFQHYKD